MSPPQVVFAGRSDKKQPTLQKRIVSEDKTRGYKPDVKRTVLGANIVTLAVRRGRVMRLPEDVEQIFKRGLRGIEDDTDDFCMAGATGADGAVAGVIRAAAEVADGGGMDARGGPKLALCAPEAARVG